MELTYTAQIRPRSTSQYGDDLPEDMHHDYQVIFDASRDYFELTVREDNKIKSIPLTKEDLLKIADAYDAFLKMREVANG